MVLTRGVLTFFNTFNSATGTHPRDRNGHPQVAGLIEGNFNTRETSPTLMSSVRHRLGGHRERFLGNASRTWPTSKRYL